jgi:hypothetical protein
MLKSDDVQLLREALDTQPLEDEEGEHDLTIEKTGDDAFDWLIAELRRGHLTPPQSIRALRLLSRLSRQFCVTRNGELLSEALRLAQDPNAHVDLRSAAAHNAVMGAVIARGLDSRVTFGGKSAYEVRELVVRATRRSLELGLLPEIDAFVREYLSASSRQPRLVDVLTNWGEYELDASIYVRLGAQPALEMLVDVLPFDRTRKRVLEGEQYLLGIEQVRDVVEGLERQLGRPATPIERLRAVLYYARHDAFIDPRDAAEG